MFFLLNAPAPTEIYTYRHTLSLHDVLPIVQKVGYNKPCRGGQVVRTSVGRSPADNKETGGQTNQPKCKLQRGGRIAFAGCQPCPEPTENRGQQDDKDGIHRLQPAGGDRKSTRLNSSH